MTTSEKKQVVANPNMFWDDDNEKLLASWSNKAKCYIWLHSKTHLFYKILNMYFAIPIIILSAVSGTSNYGIANIFPNFAYGNIIIGTMSLIVAIISFINTFLRNAELSEEHRIAVIQWSKYSRTINT
jgi:hypothetical protein